MTSLEIFTILFFFSFLHHLASAACRSKCSSDGPYVGYPFSLEHQLPSYCGYSKLTLSCNDQMQISFPEFYRDNLIVPTINYEEQTIFINDTKRCLIKWMIDNLIDQDHNYPFYPLEFLRDFEEYTFLNCSPDAVEVSAYPTMYCLSNENYKVVAVPSTSLSTPPPPSSNCSMIWKRSIPIRQWNYKDRPSPSDWEDLNFGIQLKWYDPVCHDCEASGGLCRLDEYDRFECFSPDALEDFPAAARIAVFIGLIISFLFSVFGIKFILDRTRGPQSVTELTIVRINRPVETNGGLDGATIESYRITQLGETAELANSDDYTCAICLCEYQPKETLRTIPECNHYFHVTCIDEWLRKNPTCPICRNPPEGQQNKSSIN